MIRLEIPSFAFDYSYEWSGTYSNTGNASKYYPSYTYMNMDSNVNKTLNPAFVKNANAGVVGQGICFYGMTNYADQEVTDYANYTDITHVWSQAIPVTFGTVVPLYWFNAAIVINDFTRTTSLNVGFFVNGDHRLAFGGSNYSSYRPYVAVNYGIDMTPYMYTPVVQPTDAYAGHTYGVKYNIDSDSIELYLDNIETCLAAITMNDAMNAIIDTMEAFHYNDSAVNAFRNNGGYIANITASGPGMYFYNSASAFNVYTQGNVYFSDWYCYVPNISFTEFNGLMNGNFSFLPQPKNYSYHGIMANCNKLETLSIPGCLNVIPTNFVGGTNLNRVVIHEGVTMIGNNAISSGHVLSVEVPQTAVDMSANGIYSNVSVEVNKISYNAIQHGLMFSLNCNEANIGWYEQAIGMFVNIPTAHLKPMYHSSGAASIQVIYNLPTVTNTEEGTLDIEWHNASIYPLFNQPVNLGVHSNAFSVIPTNMSDDTFDAILYLREFPNIRSRQQCTFINDYDFVLTRPTVDACVMDVHGHLTGEYDRVPAVISNHYIVNSINLRNAAGYTSGPRVLMVDVPNLINGHNYLEANNMYYPVALRINDISPDTTELHINGGYGVFIPNIQNTNMHDLTVYIANTQHVIIEYEYQYSNIFTNALYISNCNDVLIPACTDVTLDSITWFSRIPIVPNATIKDTDYSASSITFNNFAKYSVINIPTTVPEQAALLSRGTEVYNWINDYALMNLNNCLSTDAQRNSLAYITDYFNTTGDYTATNAYNCVLPATMNLVNILDAGMTFVDCTGDTHVNISGISVAQITAQPFIFNNHIGNLSFDINCARVALYRKYTTGQGREPMWRAPVFRLACNSNISDINASTYDIDMDANMSLLRDINPQAWCVSANDCNIDTIRVGNNCGLYLDQCNVNTIEYTDGPIPYIILTNCTIGGNIQSLLDNCYGRVNLIGSNFPDMSDMTVHYRLVDSDKKIAALRNVDVSYTKVSNSITVIDDVRDPAINCAMNASYTCTDHLQYIGHAGVQIQGHYNDMAQRYCPAHITVDTPVLRSASISGNFVSISGLDNCMAIQTNAFSYMETAHAITVHQNCSIHPSYEYSTHNVSLTRGNGNKYAVGLNVNYHQNRDSVATEQFANVYNLLDINIVYNDGSEERTNEYSIWPPFVYAPGASASNYRNSFHVVYTKNICNVIPAPCRLMSNGLPTTTAQLNNLMTSPQSANPTTMNFIEYKADNFPAVCANAYPSTISSSTTRRNISNVVTENAAKTTLVLKGNYSCSYNNIPYWLRDIVDLNTAVNAPNQHNGSYYERRILMCGVNFFTNTHNGYNIFNGNMHTIHLASAAPSKMLGHGTLGNSGAQHLITPYKYDNMNGTVTYTRVGTTYINSYAVRNEANLYHIDFDYTAAGNLYINANAFVNVPMLQYMTLPPCTKRINANAFSNTGLIEVKVPTGCVVAADAFPAGCTITYY